MRCVLWALPLLVLAFSLVQAVHIQLDETNLVTFAPCGARKCPPRPLQKPIGPPPRAYLCDCSDPGVHSDCRCPKNPTVTQFPNCKEGQDCRIKMAPTTTVVGLFNPDRKPVVLRRKFRPPTTAPNPLPPIKDGECRPNVFNIGPGNCYHTPDSGDYCNDAENNCANDDNGSKGFVAASLSSSSNSNDQPEQCGSGSGSSSSSSSGSDSMMSVSASSSMAGIAASMGSASGSSGSSSGSGSDGAPLFSSEANAQGEKVHAVITAKDKCGRDIKLTKDDVFIASPKRIGEPAGAAPDLSGSISAVSPVASMSSMGSASMSMSASASSSMEVPIPTGSMTMSSMSANAGSLPAFTTSSGSSMGMGGVSGSTSMASPTASPGSNSMPMMSVSMSGSAPVAPATIPAAALTAARSSVTPVKL